MEMDTRYLGNGDGHGYLGWDSEYLDTKSDYLGMNDGYLENGVDSRYL